jgi:hypothetical protein
LNYHRNHPAFSGTFDYEEYVSLMGVEDPNEGYETIFELMGLLDRVEAFQKEIFTNLRSYGNNEARIAALVPLVEESFGIYQFIVSMMAAMHTSNLLLCSYWIRRSTRSIKRELYVTSLSAGSLL